MVRDTKGNTRKRLIIKFDRRVMRPLRWIKRLRTFRRRRRRRRGKRVNGMNALAGDSLLREIIRS